VENGIFLSNIKKMGKMHQTIRNLDKTIDGFLGETDKKYKSPQVYSVQQLQKKPFYGSI
jgi:hypothetical protein